MTPNHHRKEWVIGLVVLVVLILLTMLASSQLPAPKGSNQGNPSVSGDLSTKVSTDMQGVEVANLEANDWHDCMVGLNGSTGWGFDNPPYQTRAPLDIPAGQTTTVSYEQITTTDGTRFDNSTHAVNTVVVDCGKGTTSERSWVGTLVSN